MFMKHSFPVILLLAMLLLAGCRPKTPSAFQPSSPSPQAEISFDLPDEYAEEVIITGQVLNREVYPQEKMLTLILPFFRDQENQYIAPIQQDGFFYFRLPVFAKIREISIRNYAEHLYVRPGDSIHVEIDFKDMFHPKVTGDAEKLNQEILAFTESGYYYLKDYTVNGNLDNKDFEAELKKEYLIRLERRKEYLERFKPTEDVVLLTEQLLKQDYYYALLNYASQRLYKTKDGYDRYYTLLPEINALYNKGILSARLFEIAQEAGSYVSLGMGVKKKKYPRIEEVMSVIGEDNLNQYIYANIIANGLTSNDTLNLAKSHGAFDSIVKIPHLRAQIIQIYRRTKSYMENPKPVSDNLLYGQMQEGSKFTNSLSYMEPIYKMLEKDKGKVIYFDFWTTWCPPCLWEMKPLKQLREKYSTEDLIIYSVCVGGTTASWEECLEKYSLRNCGIECIYAKDYFGEKNTLLISKQWKITSFPYYVLINREGYIIDFGASARPSNPKFVTRIEEAVKNTK